MQAAPRTLQEAEAYIGRRFWKYFSCSRHYYVGVVKEVDTEIVTDAGETETGLFFRAHYPADDDCEHLTWEQLAALLKTSAKREKKKGSHKEGAAVAANSGSASSADVAGVADRRAKRHRHGGGAAAAAAGHEAPAPSSSRQQPSSKRSRQELEEDDEQQQQEQQQRGRQRGSGQQQQRRPADDDCDVIPDSEEEAAGDGDTSGDDEQHSPLAGRASKKPRKQQQGRQRQQQDDEGDAAMGEADPVVDEAELQRQFEAQEQAAAAEAADTYDPSYEVQLRRQGLPGHIKSVQVQNFMCHENFRMEFSPHVNIISGSNGSGKSAVLQAMQAALGAKAKDTGRGDNFRELVRTGCHEAKVEVTLWNTNTAGDAFNHGLLGDWFSVVRVIKADRANSDYKVLNCAGKKVMEGVRKINDILEHLNVDATNPLAVLTQDTARNFLCGSIADKKKYELFMKATLLQSIRDSLLKAEGCKEGMVEAFKTIHADHKKRHERVVETRDKLQKLEASAGLVEKRTLFEAAAAWAMVRDRMDLLARQKELAEVTAPKRKAELEEKLSKITAQLDDLREREAALLDAHRAQEATQTQFTADMTELAARLKAANAAKKTKQRAAAKLQQEQAALQHEIKQCLEATRETNDDRQKEFEERMSKYEAELAQKREQVQQEEDALQQAAQHLEGARQAVGAKQSGVQQLQGRIQGVQYTLGNLNTQLQQLNQQRGQKLALFPRGTAEFRQAVDANRRLFDRLPIGPLGAHLTLTDGKWATAVQETLGQQMYIWLVHSVKDEKVLRSIAQKLHFRVTIWQSSFDSPAYSISADKRMPAGWHCVREFVKVDHPEYAHIIDNKLMDGSHYEVVAVDEDVERCRDAAYKSAAGNAVRKGVHISGKNFTRIRAGTVTAGNTSIRTPILGVSFEHVRAQFEEGVRNQQNQAATLQQQLTAAHAELQQLQQQVHTLDTAHRRAMGNRGRAHHALQQLQRQMPVLEADEADGEDFVAEQLRQLREKLQDVQLQADKADRELQEATLHADEARKLHDDRKAEINQTLTQVDNTMEQLDELTAHVDKWTKGKQKYEAHLQKHEADTAKAHEQVAILQEQVDQHKATALKICPEDAGWAYLERAGPELEPELKQTLRAKFEKRARQGDAEFSTREQVESKVKETLEGIMADLKTATGVVILQAKANKIDKQIAATEKEAGGNREELEQTLRRAEQAYKRTEKAFNNMQHVVRFCVKAVEQRWQKYQEQFDHVQRTVSAKFSLYMHRRGHQGRVVVDADTGVLRLLVKINSQGASAEERKKSKAVKDLKQLSGGERSFTTVAFILALGEWTESPFRALDEFDVFMDAVNRRIATQTLLEFAREKAELQFVLLTPQDLQAVEDAKRKLADSKNGKALPEGFVKIVQMRPARPGQRLNQEH